jgi:hypothetical protein
MSRFDLTGTASDGGQVWRARNALSCRIPRVGRSSSGRRESCADAPSTSALIDGSWPEAIADWSHHVRSRAAGSAAGGTKINLEADTTCLPRVTAARRRPVRDIATYSPGPTVTGRLPPDATVPSARHPPSPRLNPFRRPTAKGPLARSLRLTRYLLSRQVGVIRPGADRATSSEGAVVPRGSAPVPPWLTTGPVATFFSVPFARHVLPRLRGSGQTWRGA